MTGVRYFFICFLSGRQSGHEMVHLVLVALLESVVTAPQFEPFCVRPLFALHPDVHRVSLLS
jgi:hypothetical protein